MEYGFALFKNEWDTVDMTLAIWIQMKRQKRNASYSKTCTSVLHEDSSYDGEG